MNGLIVYRSHYGSTKTYVDWIAEETGFSVYDSRDKAIPWDDADTVVVGCPVIANKALLTGWMQKNWCVIGEKNVVLFTTSGADPAVAPMRDLVASHLPEPLKSSVDVFALAGRFDYANMNGPHKLTLWFAANVLRVKEVKNQLNHPVDGVAKENLGELLAHLKELGT